MINISEKHFSEILRDRLGIFYDHALSLFRCYGQDLACDIINLLSHAIDKGKVKEVLDLLEEYYQERLKINSIKKPPLNNNEIENLLLRACKILGLHPRTN